MTRLLRMSEAAALGVHAAAFVAGAGDQPVSVPRLAEWLRASEAHLSKVMQRLVRAGVLRSNRGPKGGFLPERDPSDITLLEVYEALEGPVESSACLFAQPICTGPDCIFGGLLAEFDAKFRAYLVETTLADLMLTTENLHVRP